MAISPIDGRYQSQTKELQEVFSEFALINFRLLVEVKWLITLTDIPAVQMRLHLPL